MNEKAQNREQFPEISKLIDELRCVYGQDQISVLWVDENGIEKGSRDKIDKSKCVIPYISYKQKDNAKPKQKTKNKKQRK